MTVDCGIFIGLSIVTTQVLDEPKASMLDPQTRLADLPILYLDMVLDEIFNVPPPWLQPEAKRPETIADVAAMIGQDQGTVTAKFRSIIGMSEGIEIAPKNLQDLLAASASGDPTRPVLVDVRERWEYDICHLADSILLTEANYPALLPQLRLAKKVVTICHHGVRSLSAALFLRQQGVETATSLAGGVDLWAVEVDTAMARY
jgi:rhodanese-related sulfurtransferase